MNDNSKVINNVCTNDYDGSYGYPGGVKIGNNATFTMNGGTIFGNTASTDGGVYKNDDGTFTYVSGVICENTPSNTYETHTTCPAS